MLRLPRHLVPFVVAIGSLGPFGCGPDDITPADLDEVCGEPSPFRLLELDRDRTIAFADQWAQIEDRRLLRIGYLDEEDQGDFPRPERLELWSAGECGEQPMLLARDASAWLTLDVWPDLPLGRWVSGEIFALDPAGQRPPHTIFAVPDGYVDITPWGLVATIPNDEQTSAVVLFPYPDDPWTQTSTPSVLLDAIRSGPDPADTSFSNYWSPAIFDDELFAITPADELIHFSLLDGTITVEATGVRNFQSSPDLRWLVWQDTTTTGTNGIGWQEGQIFLRDRSTGTDTHLADTSLSFSIEPFSFIDQGFVRLYLGGFGTDPQRFFSTSTAVTFDLPAGHWVDQRVTDGRWIDQGFYGYGPFSLFDVTARSDAPLFEHEGELAFDDEGFLILQSTAHVLLNEPTRVEGRLWSVDIDGARELLAERVARGYSMLDDGRPVSVVDADARWRGDSIVVDRDSREEQLVDARVAPNASVLEDGETMLYGVSDGERTGVWLARLAR